MYILFVIRWKTSLPSLHQGWLQKHWENPCVEGTTNQWNRYSIPMPWYAYRQSENNPLWKT
ncbi:hypothetical protein A3D11_02310 [Candidatus Peribacteria bacterium RIFCSPHIGHO2_02_FULL_49_16]|nr:MAG: hypothetical protein A2880_03770 [Candidatus Peribacteria bacterium RIFCSPHIGHO2_01_FULL_49_38]OGJ59959.1 MAG: hypothetical protein A3D11_02310 [Candidatus Peribacteria bacterium RIFCSPHIGHO2_02_FULL_49_16]